MAKREAWELVELQSLPLDLKIKKTQQRIKEWVDYWGEEGGLGYKAVIDWLNEHGNLNIKY